MEYIILNTCKINIHDLAINYAKIRFPIFRLDFLILNTCKQKTYDYVNFNSH